MSVIFTTKDLSKKLLLGKSLVREISVALEKESYCFIKHKGTRLYTEKDFEIFQKVVEMYKVNGELYEAVRCILREYTETENITIQIKKYKNTKENKVVASVQKKEEKSEKLSKDDDQDYFYPYE